MTKKELKKLKVAIICSMVALKWPIQANEELICGTQQIVEEEQISYSSYDILTRNIELNGNPYYAQTLYDVISKLNPAFQQYLVDRNVHITLLDGTESAEYLWNQTDEYYQGSITGFSNAIDWNASRVDVYVEAVQYDLTYSYGNIPEEYKSSTSIEQLNYEIVVSTLLHELGHAVDGAGLFLYSNSAEFQNLFYEESNNFVNTREFKVPNRGVYSNINKSYEYFAASFEAYLMGDPDFPVFCPNTYNYIENFMESLNELYGYTLEQKTHGRVLQK